MLNSRLFLNAPLQANTPHTLPWEMGILAKSIQNLNMGLICVWIMIVLLLEKGQLDKLEIGQSTK